MKVEQAIIMKREQYIDLARGITIFCVVFFHAAKRTDLSMQYYDYLVIPSNLTDSFIMPFFLIVSAAFLRKRLESANFSKTAFLKKIISSLLKPFYTLSLLFFILNLVAPKSMGRPSASEMIKAMLTLNFKGESMPSSILWFLFVLFVFAFFTFVFIKVLKVNVYVLFIFSILLRWSNHYWYEYLSFFAINKFGQYYIFYIVGYLLSVRILRGSFFLNNKFNLAILVCWLVTFYFTFTLKVDYLSMVISSLGICGISGSLFVLYFCNKINNKFSFKPISDFLGYCGENSILIYVFHTASFLLFRTIIHNTALYYSLWGFILEILCGISLPLIIGKLLSQNVFIYKLLLGKYP